MKLNEDGIMLATSAVRKEEVVFKRAAKFHYVPRSTLQRCVNDTSLDPNEVMATALGGKTVVPRENEDSLLNYFSDMYVRYFALSAADVRPLDYQLAIRNGLPHPFSHDKAVGENNRLKGFFKRQPCLSVRSSQRLYTTKSYNRKSRSQQVFFFFWQLRVSI
jgi:hypothetical protein